MAASLWSQPQDADADRLAQETGATAGPLPPGLPIHTGIVNETGLPDDFVQEVAQQWMTDVYFAENASLAGAQSTFQTYVNDGSLLARHRYRTPTNTIEEMKLARDLAERDDDIRAIMGGMIALAFEHLEHYSKDARTTEVFNEIATPRHMDLRSTLKECYREYLITSSFTTVKLFTSELIDVSQDAEDGEYNANPTKLPIRVLTPHIGVLPAENIRCIGSSLLMKEQLAYWPGDDRRLTKFLEEFFNPLTSAARLNEMRKEDPVSTTLFIRPVKIEDAQQSLLIGGGGTYTAYLMNPSMVHRTTMPKGYWPYARPLLAACFGLLEAKRLLNIMDFALLQGAANYIVVAKKGSDLKPALPAEIQQLRELVRHIGRTGVVVGDHRLSFEILTPELNDLLSADKRNLIGRKLAMAILRKPENITSDAASAGAQTEAEWIARVITDDRTDILHHIEMIYQDTVDVNPSVLKGCPSIWAPKIVLEGAQYFTDYVLKLRDRGDIPRKYAVQAAGFDFAAAVAERERELAADIDTTMLPAAVPYTVPGSVADQTVAPEVIAPNDNGGGRPRGGSSNNGRPGSKPSRSTKDPARPTRTIHRNAGETVKAWREDGMTEHYRMGELTRGLLKIYEDTAENGRLTAFEKKAILTDDVVRSGPLTIVPVNTETDLLDLRVVRLGAGANLYVGMREDGAIMARALGFRAPEFDQLTAEETAMEWGFMVEGA